MSNPENENSPEDVNLSEDPSQQAADQSNAEDTTSANDPAADQTTTSEAESDDVLRKLRSENAELQDRLLRTQAELENFRRRTQKEAADAFKYQALPVIRDLLPGVDNLHRAIDAAEASGDTQNLIDGIKMVAQQFLDALKAHSAERFNPEGDAFDPNLHEALSQIPSAEHDPMTILQVIEPGYRLHDRVIRPAKVIVSCAPPSE